MKPSPRALLFGNIVAVFFCESHMRIPIHTPLAASLLLISSLRADPPADAPPPAQPWGARVGDLQSRISITNTPTKGSPLQVTAELRNVSDQPIPLANIRVWLMVAQGPKHAFYTSPFAGPEKKTLDAGDTLQITFDAAPLTAYPYTSDLIINNGLPGPAPITPDSHAPPTPPAALGKLTDVLPIGPVKAKAFVAVTFIGQLSDTETTHVVPSQAFLFKVAEPDFATLTPAQQVSLLTDLFRGDAVSAKAAHDRAVQIGTSILPNLIKLLDDNQLSDAGRAWLTATLVDLHDDHATDALIKILDKGGQSAYIVAYMGPRIKDPRVTAAIETAAQTTDDPMLTAWAIRGLGLAGEKTDPTLLEPMVTHSDPAGRVEAADILAAHPDPRAIPLLAKLIGDDDTAVRIHAAQAAAAHDRKDKAIIAALESMKQRSDFPSRTAAQEALNHLQQEHQ